MRRKLLMVVASFSLVLVLAAMPFMAACAPEEPPPPPPPPTDEEEPPPPLPEKDSIVIGGARPLSGPNQAIGDFAFGPIYNMWVEDVNAKGGIYVEEYGKKLPIELIIYDDTSDIGTMTMLLERLILEDEVDFLLSPCSTAFLFAASSIFDRYEYIFLGAEGGCTTLTAMLPELPWQFSVLNYSDHNQVPVMADLFVEWGVETVAYIYIADLHGIEYAHTAESEFLKKGITVVMSKSVPPYAADVELLLKEAKALEVDAFCVFAYPPTTLVVVPQAMAIDFNPKAIVLGPGGNFQFFSDMYGAEVLEGVSGFGAWNAKSSPAAAEFADKFNERWTVGLADWWGGLHYWAALQFFEQAIVEAGTLDQAVIRDVMATSTFDTVLGPTWFEGGVLAVECYAGQVGQWQSGIFEVIDPGEKRTADPIYPKPDWSTAE